MTSRVIVEALPDVILPVLEVLHGPVIDEPRELSDRQLTPRARLRAQRGLAIDETTEPSILVVPTAPRLRHGADDVTGAHLLDAAPGSLHATPGPRKKPMGAGGDQDAPVVHRQPERRLTHLVAALHHGHAQTTMVAFPARNMLVHRHDSIPEQDLTDRLPREILHQDSRGRVEADAFAPCLQHDEPDRTAGVDQRRSAGPDHLLRHVVAKRDHAPVTGSDTHGLDQRHPRFRARHLARLANTCRRGRVTSLSARPSSVTAHAASSGVM